MVGCNKVTKECGMSQIKKDKLTDLQQQISPFKFYIQKEVPMSENLLEFYRKSDGASRKKIPGCIFSEKLVLENGRVATSTFTLPIEFILNASEILGSSRKKKEVENDLLSRLVPRTDKSYNLINDISMIKGWE